MHCSSSFPDSRCHAHGSSNNSNSIARSLGSLSSNAIPFHRHIQNHKTYTHEGQAREVSLEYSRQNQSQQQPYTATDLLFRCHSLTNTAPLRIRLASEEVRSFGVWIEVIMQDNRYLFKTKVRSQKRKDSWKSIMFFLEWPRSYNA